MTNDLLKVVSLVLTTLNTNKDACGAVNRCDADVFASKSSKTIKLVIISNIFLGFAFLAVLVTSIKA